MSVWGQVSLRAAFAKQSPGFVETEIASQKALAKTFPKVRPQTDIHPTALVLHTLLLLNGLPGLASYRSYDRAEFAWGLFFAVYTVAVAATRPHAFITHTIVVVLAVFLTVLAIPNRFANQLALSLLYTAGETLVLAAGLRTSPQDSVTALLSM